MEMENKRNSKVIAHIESIDNETKETTVLVGRPDQEDEREYDGVLFVGIHGHGMHTVIHGMNMMHLAMAIADSEALSDAAKLSTIIGKMKSFGKSDEGDSDGAQ